MSDLVVRVLLKVIGRKPVFFRADKSLEVEPGASRLTAKKFAIAGVEAFDPDASRPTDEGRNLRRRHPEHQQQLAGTNAAGRTSQIAAPNAIDKSGASHICRQKSAREFRVAKWVAMSLAGTHSSKCRRVTARRQSVRKIASQATALSLARKATEKSHGPVWFRKRRNAPRTAPRRRPLPMPVTRSVKRWPPSAAAVSAVHTHGLPGSTSQATAANTIRPGGIRLRRRLSIIFQRSRRDKGLAYCSPLRCLTRRASHGSSCQSPRTQRCQRREYSK